MTLALAQIAHLGNARSAEAVLRPARVIANPYALAGAFIAVGLQVATVWIEPLADILRVTPLDGRDWLVIVAAAALPAVVGTDAEEHGTAGEKLTVRPKNPRSPKSGNRVRTCQIEARFDRMRRWRPTCSLMCGGRSMRYSQRFLRLAMVLRCLSASHLVHGLPAQVARPASP